MLRMDLLLNPRSPPPSPTPSERVENTSTGKPQSTNSLALGHSTPLVEPILNANNRHCSPPKTTILPTLQRRLPMIKTPDSTSSAQVVKRLKRDLPALRLLLDSGGNDNQRDDAPHEIFSGHAFWGKVSSLNPPASSPSDVLDLGTSSVLSKSSAATSSVLGASFVQVSNIRRLPLLVTAASAPLSEAMTQTDMPIAAPQVVATTQVDSPAQSAEEESLSVDADGVATTTTTPFSKNGKKKKISICKEDGCSSQALSKQLCMKHGGGPRCSVPDCNNGAKLRNLCFQHGGSTICLAPTCSSKAKRFGYCWSHGGGRICGEDDCNKVAAQGGMCWAHGGGNRCKLAGCTKRSYKQNAYYCKRHAEVSADY